MSRRSIGRHFTAVTDRYLVKLKGGPRHGWVYRVGGRPAHGDTAIVEGDVSTAVYDATGEVEYIDREAVYVFRWRDEDATALRILNTIT